MPKIAALIVGIETIKDKHTGEVTKLSQTFLNNINTWVKDNPSYTSHVFDARDFLKFSNPLLEVFNNVSKLGPLDTLVYSGHSGPEKLFVFYNCRQELSDSHRTINFDTCWDGMKFNSDANIWLQGCQTGGVKGEKWPVCIAQDIADKTGTTTWGFTSRSAQKKTGNKFYQIPDYGSYIKFTKD